MSDDPDYIVLRGMPGLPEGWMGDKEGRWYDLRDVPIGPWREDGENKGWKPGTARAFPTGRFEVREDGAVAEVWEVGP